MRRSRLAAGGAVGAVLLVLAATGVAPAAGPAVTGSQAFAAGTPSAISCNGSVDATVSVTGQSGTSGTATDVMIGVDLSGSTGDATKLADLKRAAKDTLIALDSADGAADHVLGGNAVGLTFYQGTTAGILDPIGSSYDAVDTHIGNLPDVGGGSPHNVGIDTAAAALSAANGHAKAIVLITDGQTASTTEFNAVTASADAAKMHHIVIVPIGIGTGSAVSPSNLQSWATAASFYQSATATPIDKTKLGSDLGALTAALATFTVKQTPGPTFLLAKTPSPPAPIPNPSTGTVTGGGSLGTPLQWTGTVASGQTVTLTYRATRTAGDVFSTQSEVVSTMGLSVAGGGTATPTALSINVLPCGATPIASTTCTGAACTVSGSRDGAQYTLNAGAAPAGTNVTLAGLNTRTLPAGACPGFHAHTTGAEFDIRPLTRDATFRMVIPRASLGTLRWFQTDVCLGTNLRFITAIQSLANLSPAAALVDGGALPDRYWGLLPSIPRIDWFPGRGFVVGPWITSRSQDAAGNAVITFVVPFVANSTGLTTDLKAAYDPKLWG